MDENFDRKLIEMYKEIKRLYWDEIQKKRRTGYSSGGDEVKDDKRRMLKESENMKRRWTEYFEKLMNVNNQRKTTVACMATKIDECEQSKKDNSGMHGNKN